MREKWSLSDLSWKLFWNIFLFIQYKINCEKKLQFGVGLDIGINWQRNALFRRNERTLHTRIRTHTHAHANTQWMRNEVFNGGCLNNRTHTSACQSVYSVSSVYSHRFVYGQMIIRFVYIEIALKLKCDWAKTKYKFYVIKFIYAFIDFFQTSLFIISFSIL